MPYTDINKRRDSQKRIRDRNRAFIVAYLKKHPCISCGYSNIIALEFDHIDPASKSYDVSRMWASMHFSIKSIESEIAKCQVLCSNCHRLKTYKERNLTWADK